MEKLLFGPVRMKHIKAAFEPENPEFFILCDENTRRYCLDIFLEEMSIPFLVLPAGDAHKNWDSCQAIWDFAFEKGFSRKAVCINLGGGMLCDLGGMAASLYKRGLRFVHVPTSLLSMVDASVGGKTGINFRGLKNALGLFSEPERVYIDNSWLSSLPQIELLSGKAEMIKHSLISDIDRFDDWCNAHIPAEADIRKSISMKQEIVQQDPKESGVRKMLNLGHTAGHAIESLLLQQDRVLPHGICVAAGLIIEMYVAESIGFAEKGVFDAYTKKIKNLFGKLELKEEDAQAWLAYIFGDKKNSDSDIRAVLLKRPGEVHIDIKVEEEAWLNAYKKYIHEN